MMHVSAFILPFIASTVPLSFLRVDDRVVSTQNASLHHGTRVKLMLRVHDPVVSTQDASLHHGTRVSARNPPCQSGAWAATSSELAT